MPTDGDRITVRSLINRFQTLVRRIEQSLSAGAPSDAPLGEDDGSMRLRHNWSGDDGRVLLYLMSGDRHVGKLGYQACGQCGIGTVLKISVYESYDRQGVGRLLLCMLRERHPGLVWYTSWQQPSAVDFWLKMARESGEPYTQRNSFCAHASLGPSPMIGPIPTPNPRNKGL